MSFSCLLAIVILLVVRSWWLSAQLRTRSERVHLVAGWSDIGASVRQLRLRHRQRIEGFSQQLDLTCFCHQVPSEQMMGRSPGRSGARVRHIFGERLFRCLDGDMDV